MSFDTSSIGAIPTTALQLNQTKLITYLQTTLPDLFSATDRLDIKQLTYGLSNPTYIVRAAEKTYVLRKKPPGKLLPSAHQIEREVEVLRALELTNVPVPTVIHFCADEQILGTPFYLMNHVKGKVYTDPNFPLLTVKERTEAYNSMAETLAKLHDVDVEKVGLASFGNPRGYCQRQVKRWWKQYEKSIPIPSIRMTRLKDCLLKLVPKTDQQPIRPTIAHGDPSLANLIFAGSQVHALVDWELSTLGDVWADLAYNCLPYYGPFSETLPIIIDPLTPGIPTEEEYIFYYAQLRRIALPSQQDWAFYKALALFRLASICQGVFARATQGNASSDRAREVGSLENVDLLAKRGLDILQFATSPKTTYLTSSLDFGPFEVSPKAKSLIQRLSRFMDKFILPLEEEVERHETSEDRWKVFPKMKALKKEAQTQGLWNLFIPPGMQSEIWKLDSLSVEEKKSLSGHGLTNVEYHFIAELMGRCLWASEIFNCQAPDTGNMEILSHFGTPEQKEEYLLPLLKGECRSCFGMTEKMVASSDARNIQSSVEVSPAGQVTLSGRKWWTTGALHPEVKFCIFMGKTDPSKPAYRQQTMVLVPMNAPGICVRRQMLQFGYDDAPVGHPEIDFYNVRVSMRNILGQRGQGFEIAQSRLGPGRLHHCMRLIGLGKRSLETAKDRLQARVAFGSLLSEKSSVQMSFGSAAIDLRAARLLVLSAADSLDRHGGKVARYHIAAAKVFVPKTMAKIIDLCMQYYGGAGLSNDVPLSRMYAAARALRIADGPDEVHTISIGKSELGDKFFVSNL